MNKQELIERIEGLKNLFGNKAEYIEIDMAIRLISELDEPQKPVVPQFVANWIEECKNDDFHLFGAMEGISSNRKKLDYWFREDDNMEIFALAWINGYHIEEEKRYYVKLKAIDQYLVRNEDENFLGFLQSRLKSKFTRKQLEQAELGWVFDCPGIEIEEVEG